MKKKLMFIVASIGLLLVSGCANIYKDCVRTVNNPDSIVFFAITENKKTEAFCGCVEKTQDWGKCFNEVLK